MSKRKLNASEAVYGFVAWLTTREKKTIMSRKHNCSEVADLVKEFCQANNFIAPRGGWEKSLINPYNCSEEVHKSLKEHCGIYKCRKCGAIL